MSFQNPHIIIMGLGLAAALIVFAWRGADALFNDSECRYCRKRKDKRRG